VKRLAPRFPVVALAVVTLAAAVCRAEVRAAERTEVLRREIPLDGIGTVVIERGRVLRIGSGAGPRLDCETVNGDIVVRAR
jgi:hypothetical protein